MRPTLIIVIMLFAPTIVGAHGQKAQPSGANDKKSFAAYRDSTSTTIVSKSIKLPAIRLFGLAQETLKIECVRAHSIKDSQVIFRGVTLRAEGNNLSSSCGIELEELPGLVAAIRNAIKDAAVATVLDFGELGKVTVATEIDIVTIDGTHFLYTAENEDDFSLIIGGRMISADKEVFTSLADALERASKLLKKLG
jgi:hypothetical protein